MPLGRGGTEPTSVLLVPEGARPSATTLVPAVMASAAAAGAVTTSVPVRSTRARNAGLLPTRTETTDRPRNPTPPTRRPAPLCVTTAAGATAAEPRPTTSSRAGRRGLSLEDGAGVGEAVLAPAVAGSLGDVLGLEADGLVDEVVGTDVVGVALLEVGADVAVPGCVGVLGVVTGVEVQLTDSLSALPP